VINDDVFSLQHIFGLIAKAWILDDVGAVLIVNIFFEAGVGNLRPSVATYVQVKIPCQDLNS